MLRLIEPGRIATRLLLTRHIDGEKARTKRFDLLLDGGSDIERRNHSTETPRSRNRLQARHAGSQHQHATRLDRTCRRHQQWEQSWRSVGSQQHTVIAGHRGLRRKGIHRLGPRRAGHKLESEEGCTRLCQALRPHNIAERIEERDDGVSRRQRREFVGCRWRNARDQRGAGMRRHGIADNFCTGRTIGLIAVARSDARATLNEDTKSVSHERLNDRRYQGDAILVCGSLNRYSNCDVRHVYLSSRAFVQPVIRVLRFRSLSGRYLFLPNDSSRAGRGPAGAS